MKQLKYFILFSSVIALFSCRKEPNACFESSLQKVAINEVIQFTNCSSDAEEYEWNFGDGVNETISEPSHQYENIGIYTVKMRAFSKKDFTETNKMIEVGKYNFDKIEIETEEEWDYFVVKVAGQKLFQSTNYEYVPTIDEKLALSTKEDITIEIVDVLDFNGIPNNGFGIYVFRGEYNIFTDVSYNNLIIKPENTIEELEIQVKITHTFD